MANIIVVTFTKETNALEALHKIKKLDNYGDITLYEYVIICKKETNQFEILNDTNRTGWQTLTSNALTSIVEAFSGPIGLVIGLFTGTVADTIIDFERYDFEDAFIKKINNKITADNTTLIAEVGEDNTFFINNTLIPYKVDVLRTDADAAYLDFIEDEIERLEDKIEEQRKKLKNTTTKEKEKIRRKVEDLKAKRKTKIAKLESKEKSTLQELKDKTKATLNTLETKLEDFETTISNTVTKGKTLRLKRRINRQRAKLNRLNKRLNVLQNKKY